MDAVHNSGDPVVEVGRRGSSRPSASDSPELWTHAVRGLARGGEALVRAGRAVGWYITTLMGDTAYATYVAHQRRHHPDEPPLSERRFWRERMDAQDRNPGARCC